MLEMNSGRNPAQGFADDDKVKQRGVLRLRRSGENIS